MKEKKPTTPGQRGMKVVDYSILTKKEPEKSLLITLKKKAGRNNSGKITVRHRGGGEKRKYRIVDFGQEKMNIKGKVEALEYDPNRSAFLMLVLYEDGERRYRIAPEGIKVGDEIICKEDAEPKLGNRLKLKNIPIGVPIFELEFFPGQGGKLVRSAGSSAQILSKEGGFVNIVLPSKEIRKFSEDCFATIGQASNVEHHMEVLGKAGRKRKRGIRPTVRGTAMNPVDHPHGGGEGRAPIGLKHPKTPTGKPALGVKTRKKGKMSDKFIIRRRKKKK
jgi:large subunit ribosomal protein L2